MPYITIGIASYNYAHYLRQGFEAIRQQRFKDFEVLYADDGSTDDSVAMIETFIRDNPDMDIRIIKGHNIGVMGNKQRLIDNARGTYLMLCDADDWMDDDCIETLASAAMESGADRIVSEIRNVDGPTGRTLFVQSLPEHPSKWCEILHHGALYKLSVIRDNNIAMPDCLPDDYVFVSLFNAYAHSTFYVHKSVYNWRQHTDSVNQKQRHDNPWRGYNLIYNILKFFSSFRKDYSERISGDDIEDLELCIMKCYCFYLIHDISLISPCQEARKEYNRMKALMNNYIPNYADVILQRNPGHSPFRRKLHIALYCLCLLERVGLLFPSLMVYGFVLKGAGRNNEA